MKRVIALILTFSILLCACGQATAKADLSGILNETAEVLLAQVPEPAPGSAGGEWTVLGMARWGGEVPAGWFEGYEERLAEYVTSCGGVLHDRKYTEYSRVVLAVTAMGGDARDVAGYDLTVPLADFDQTVFQGVNGAIYALLALDSGGYGSGELREKYIAYILGKESSGGWSLMGGAPEADLTAMALQALAKYRGREDVAAAVERGLSVLAETDFDTSESASQTIVALCELGIGMEDERFRRDGKDLLDQLLAYRTEDGMFRHMPDTGGDLLATEQAFCALTALGLAEKGGSLYALRANACGRVMPE